MEDKVALNNLNNLPLNIACDIAPITKHGLDHVTITDQSRSSISCAPSEEENNVETKMEETAIIPDNLNLDTEKTEKFPEIKAQNFRDLLQDRVLKRLQDKAEYGKRNLPEQDKSGTEKKPALRKYFSNEDLWKRVEGRVAAKREPKQDTTIEEKIPNTKKSGSSDDIKHRIRSMSKAMGLASHLQNEIKSTKSIVDKENINQNRNTSDSRKVSNSLNHLDIHQLANRTGLEAASSVYEETLSQGRYMEDDYFSLPSVGSTQSLFSNISEYRTFVDPETCARNKRNSSLDDRVLAEQLAKYLQSHSNVLVDREEEPQVLTESLFLQYFSELNKQIRADPGSPLVIDEQFLKSISQVTDGEDVTPTATPTTTPTSSRSATPTNAVVTSQIGCTNTVVTSQIGCTNTETPPKLENAGSDPAPLCHSISVQCDVTLPHSPEQDTAQHTGPVMIDRATSLIILDDEDANESYGSVGLSDANCQTESIVLDTLPDIVDSVTQTVLESDPISSDCKDAKPVSADNRSELGHGDTSAVSGNIPRSGGEVEMLSSPPRLSSTGGEMVSSPPRLSSTSFASSPVKITVNEEQNQTSPDSYLLINKSPVRSISPVSIMINRRSPDARTPDTSVTSPSSNDSIQKQKIKAKMSPKMNSAKQKILKNLLNANYLFAGSPDTSLTTPQLDTTTTTTPQLDTTTTTQPEVINNQSYTMINIPGESLQTEQGENPNIQVMVNFWSTDQPEEEHNTTKHSIPHQHSHEHGTLTCTSVPQFKEGEMEALFDDMSYVCQDKQEKMRALLEDLDTEHLLTSFERDLGDLTCSPPPRDNDVTPRDNDVMSRDSGLFPTDTLLDPADLSWVLDNSPEGVTSEIGCTKTENSPPDYFSPHTVLSPLPYHLPADISRDQDEVNIEPGNYISTTDVNPPDLTQLTNYMLTHDNDVTSHVTTDYMLTHDNDVMSPDSSTALYYPGLNNAVADDITDRMYKHSDDVTDRMFKHSDDVTDRMYKHSDDDNMSIPSIPSYFKEECELDNTVSSNDTVIFNNDNMSRDNEVVSRDHEVVSRDHGEQNQAEIDEELHSLGFSPKMGLCNEDRDSMYKHSDDVTDRMYKRRCDVTDKSHQTLSLPFRLIQFLPLDHDHELQLSKKSVSEYDAVDNDVTSHDVNKTVGIQVDMSCVEGSINQQTMSIRQELHLLDHETQYQARVIGQQVLCDLVY